MRDEIIERYNPRLKRIAHRFDAEDLFQSVCLQSITTRYHCRGQNSRGRENWIRKIAENSFRSAMRRHAKCQKRSVAIESQLDESSRPIEDKKRDASCMEQKQWLEQIEREASELPYLQSECFKMRYFDHQEIPAISSRLGISPNATRKNISYATQKIRSRLRQQPLC
ncbi:MAG: RNA polymerase sigma factor [Aureliella sp.]